MKEIVVTIKNKAGIHVRPSSLFCKTAEGFVSDIRIEKDGKLSNGKSPMDLLMLTATQGTVLKIIAEGVDEDAALEALFDLVEVRTFNEE